MAVYADEMTPTEIKAALPTDYGSIRIPKETFPKGNGLPIPIYIPPADGGSNSNIGDWNTVFEISGGEVKFSQEKFLGNIARLQLKSPPDAPGIDTGSAAAGSIAAGLLSALSTAFEENRFRVTIQENRTGGNFRAVIEIFVDAGAALRKNAGGVISSPDASNSLACIAFSNWLKDKFGLPKAKGYYQGYWLIDKKHNDDQYIAYFALLPKVNAVIISPKVYPGDRFEIKDVKLLSARTVMEFSGEEYVGLWAYRMPFNQAETLKVLDLLPFSLNGEVTPPQSAPGGILTTVHGYAAPSGSTLVPVRDIAEWCGAKVSFDPKTQTIYCKGDDTNVSLTIGKKTAQVIRRDGIQTIALTQPAMELDGMVLVSLRAVCEAFRIQVTTSTKNDDYYGTKVRTVKLDNGKQIGIIFIHEVPPSDVNAIRQLLRVSNDSGLKGYDDNKAIIYIFDSYQNYVHADCYMFDYNGDSKWNWCDGWELLRKNGAGKWEVLFSGSNTMGLYSELRAKGVSKTILAHYGFLSD